MRVFATAPTGRVFLYCAVALVLRVATPPVAWAEPGCARTPEGPRQAWASPLDRPVTVHARNIVLRDALDRVAVAARLRLSYSPDGVPLDRSVCISFDSVAVGDVLSQLLAGTSLSPIAAGDNQVVLAPALTTTARRAERDSAPAVNVLERVFITSTSLRPGSSAVATASDVIERAQLARQNTGGSSLSETLNGAVPGLWVWNQAPSSLIAHYGSLRGASSFGVSYPKIYIDGIEVANPALLTEVNPEAIQSIGVIRGPEGAALYGADAIGGVINIVMRHDPGSSNSFAKVRGTAGVTHSSFAQRPVLVQEHTLDLRGGDDERSSALSLMIGSVGSYMPGARSWDAGADAGLRLIGASTMVTGTARLYAKEAGAAAAASPFAASQTVREYTLGTTALFAPDDRWTHSFTVGLDGYDLSGGQRSAPAPSPTTVDSALLAAPGAGNRATIRASSVARLSSADASAAITLAAEHSTLWAQAAAGGGPRLERSYDAQPTWQSNTGVFGQLEASFRNALFATGGLRVEHYDGLGASGGLVSLPMIGGAVAHSFGIMTAKLRASYGRAARSPAAAVRASWIEHESALSSRLVPEEQSGLEGGLDLSVGSIAALRVTGFDQHAYSLIQPVAIASAMFGAAGPGSSMQLLYQLQNVGEIGNRGWELESTVAAGELSMTGTFSLVDSRVRRLSANYTGDLRPGDRMLAVPARSGGLTAMWKARTWSGSVTATRAADWVNYDAVALATASAAPPVVGERLRSFWRLYPGVTRLDASVTRDVFRRFTLALTTRNLLDVQRGEPDNLTIVPGRTVSAGVTATF